MQKMVHIRTGVKTTFKLGLAFGLVAWLVSRGSLDLSQLLREVRWFHFLGGIVICLVMLGLNNWRWFLLLRKQGIDMSFSQVFRLTMIGQFFNYMVPGGVGGDVVKGYYLVRDSQ